MSHTLVLTCAGESSRFPGMAPKWTLPHPSGHIMAAAAAGGLRGWDRLVVVVTEAGADRHGYDRLEHDFRHLVRDVGEDLHIAVIEPQSSQVDSVIAALSGMDPDLIGPFTVRDCDNGVRGTLKDRTSIGLVDLHGCGAINAGNKSYALLEGGRVLATAEKRIISPYFCCGVWTFGQLQDFYDGYAASGEAQWMSEVMQGVIRVGGDVHASFMGDFVDWGTAEDWRRYLAGL